jgi:hypothetical protein
MRTISSSICSLFISFGSRTEGKSWRACYHSLLQQEKKLLSMNIEKVIAFIKRVKHVKVVFYLFDVEIFNYCSFDREI